MDRIDSTLLSSHMTILEPRLRFRVKYFGNEGKVLCSLNGSRVRWLYFLKRVVIPNFIHKKSLLAVGERVHSG